MSLHNTKTKNHFRFASILMLASVGIMAAAIVIKWLVGSQTMNSNIVEIRSTSVNCVANTPKNAFFVIDGQESTIHQLKIVFSGDSPKIVYYTLDADFQDNASAASTGSSLHAKYNKYLSSNGIDIGVFSPAFNAIDSHLKISLFGHVTAIDGITNSLFFLDEMEAKNLSVMTTESLVEVYNSHGFKCEIFK